MKPSHATAIGLATLLLLFAGCGGQSSREPQIEYNLDASALLDSMTIRFLGDPDVSETPVAMTRSRQNLLLAVNRKPHNAPKDQPYTSSLQLRDRSGNLLWDVDYQDRHVIGVLSLVDDVEVALLHRFKAEGTVPWPELGFYATNDGHEINHCDVMEWDPSFPASGLYWVGKDSFLVLGRKTIAQDLPLMTTGVICTAKGRLISKWQPRASRLFSLHDGFLGVEQMPERKPDRALVRLSYDGEEIWRIAEADSTIGMQTRGVAEAGNGDLIISGWDWENYRGVFARVRGSDGAILWIQHLETGLATHLYNPIPWGEDRFLICGQKSFGEPGMSIQFWESLLVLVVDGDGTILDDDARADVWMMPNRGVQLLGPEKALFVGIGGADPVHMKDRRDVAWAILERSPRDSVSSSDWAQ